MLISMILVEIYIQDYSFGIFVFHTDNSYSLFKDPTNECRLQPSTGVRNLTKSQLEGADLVIVN